MYSHDAIPASAQPARLDTSRYAFDGDFVSLGADILVQDAGYAASRPWLLQLWAAAADTGRVKLAEAVCRVDGAGPDGRIRLHATAAAHPPAGKGGHRLSLVLATDDGIGVRVLDQADFPCDIAFVQPSLDGTAGYRIDEDGIAIQVGRVFNPRPADNLSGTLALELWALPAPYRGGAFSGIQLGSVALGSLAGQAEWTDVARTLPRPSLPAGSWHFALMLREWTGNGYLTRDYSNFALPVDGPLHSTLAAAPIAHDLDTVDAVEQAAAPAPDAVPAPVAEPAMARPADKRAAKRAAKSGAARRPAASADKNTVSINHDPVDRIAAIKGLPTRVAEAIVAGRPWQRIEDLRMVKGMGDKLLDKLRAFIRL